MEITELRIYRTYECVRAAGAKSNWVQEATDTLQYRGLSSADWTNVKIVEAGKLPDQSVPFKSTPNNVVEKTLLTTDRDNPGLNKSPNEDGTGMNSVYLVLSDEELAKGFVRPYRDSYSHNNCGKTTTMGRKLSETYAANPKFYIGTFCSFCNAHYPVGQFRWTKDNEVVGS